MSTCESVPTDKLSGKTTVYLGMPIKNGYCNKKILTATSSVPATATLNGRIIGPNGKWHITVYKENDKNHPLIDGDFNPGKEFPQKDVKIDNNQLVIYAEVKGTEGENTTLEAEITIVISL